ncbi:MAG: twin-arginine translocase TatA/TatE family subunit [Owenweeksia sp.]|nr:twin-arginine translocase TatA/TatE family subunit [Owenweeksia sp.]
MSGTLLFLNLGGGEIFFIILITVMLFGAKRIPEIARGLGKGIRDVRNATNDIKREINDSSPESDLKKFREKVEKEKKEVEEITGSIKRNLNG